MGIISLIPQNVKSTVAPANPSLGQQWIELSNSGNIIQEWNYASYAVSLGSPPNNKWWETGDLFSTYSPNTYYSFARNSTDAASLRPLLMMPADRDLIIQKLEWNPYVSGTVNSSDYWELSISGSLNFASGKTTTPGTNKINVPITGFVSRTSGSPHLLVQVRAIGTPGNIALNQIKLTYRLVR